MRHLACDGPLNGLYIDGAQAEANGYRLDEWPNGEQVYTHDNTPILLMPSIQETIEFLDVADPDVADSIRVSREVGFDKLAEEAV
jgi:hypothetical protein